MTQVVSAHLPGRQKRTEDNVSIMKDGPRSPPQVLRSSQETQRAHVRRGTGRNYRGEEDRPQRHTRVCSVLLC